MVYRRSPIIETYWKSPCLTASLSASFCLQAAINYTIGISANWLLKMRWREEKGKLLSFTLKLRSDESCGSSIFYPRMKKLGFCSRPVAEKCNLSGQKKNRLEKINFLGYARVWSRLRTIKKSKSRFWKSYWISCKMNLRTGQQGIHNWNWMGSAIKKKYTFTQSIDLNCS